jgi:hypothetical protein
LFFFIYLIKFRKFILGDRSFDENTQFEYLKDDIRLCTIQRSTSDQLIGICHYYNKQGNFHYIKLIDNYENTLAFRGGIRNYDRFIYLNGINIENESLEQITLRFKNEINLHIQLLVCSPSTYHYYKSNNINIHLNLPTIQYLKPVFDKSFNQIIFNKKTILEDLPNELFYEIFDYIKLEDLDNCFKNLNTRFNKFLFSINNLSLIYNDNLNFSLIKSYQIQIKHLIIDTSNECDLKLFPNLNSLIILNRNLNHLKQIQSKIIPHLKYLSFKFKFHFKYPNQLIDQIFSNEFPNLIYLNIGWIKRSNWSICLNLKIISIHCNQLMIIEDILITCPNLISLQIHLLYQSDISINNFSLNCHQLEKFILTSEEFELTLDLINYLFYLMSNIRYLYLQTKLTISFYYFIQFIFKKLNYLNQFHCFIKEYLIPNQRIENLNEIHQISSCFKRIQCIKETELFRIFSTD